MSLTSPPRKHELFSQVCICSTECPQNNVQYKRFTYEVSIRPQIIGPCIPSCSQYSHQSLRSCCNLFEFNFSLHICQFSLTSKLEQLQFFYLEYLPLPPYLGSYYTSKLYSYIRCCLLQSLEYLSLYNTSSCIYFLFNPLPPLSGNMIEIPCFH